MPSPIAHSVTGYVLSRVTMQRASWPAYLSCVFLANAADLDFLAELLDIGKHRGITHSIPLAVSLSAFVGITYYFLSRKKSNHKSSFAIFSITLLVYVSHLLLDFYTQGGDGLPLLAPLSQDYFQASHPIFPGVRHSEGFFYKGHFIFIVFESFYSAAILSLLWVWTTFKVQFTHRIFPKLSIQKRK